MSQESSSAKFDQVVDKLSTLMYSFGEISEGHPLTKEEQAEVRSDMEDVVRSAFDRIATDVVAALAMQSAVEMLAAEEGCRRRARMARMQIDAYVAEGLSVEIAEQLVVRHGPEDIEVKMG